MDARTNQLNAASFDGVPFFVRNEVKTADGRRIVLHEYANSNRRDIEDTGLIPPTFTVEAFVTGNDWLQQAERLRTALRAEGAKRLVMPVFGSFLAYAQPFTERAQQTAVGQIDFSLTFSVGDAKRAPSQVDAREVSDVYDLGDTTRQSIEQEFEKLWIEPSQTNNVITANYDVITMVNTVENVVNKVTTTTKDIKAAADSIKNGVNVYIRNASDLAGSIYVGLSRERVGFLQAISTALSGTSSAFYSILKITSFGSDLSLSLADIKGSKPENQVEFTGTDIPLWDETTAERINRNKNRKSLVQSVRIAALVASYEQAAATEYLTKEEIQSVRSQVEQAYKDLFLSQANDDTAIQNTPGVLDSIRALRDAALNVLLAKEQEAFALTTIEQQRGLSSIVLAYDLYAEAFQNASDLETRAKQLRDLNKYLSAIKLEGSEVEVFKTRQSAI